MQRSRDWSLCQAARELHVRPPLPQLGPVGHALPSLLMPGGHLVRMGPRPRLLPPLFEDGPFEQQEGPERRQRGLQPQALPNLLAPYADARAERAAVRAGAVVAARAAVAAARNAGARLGLHIPDAGEAAGAAAGREEEEGLGEGSGDVSAGRRASQGRRLLERLTQSLRHRQPCLRPRGACHGRPTFRPRAASARWPPHFRCQSRAHCAPRRAPNRPVSVPANYRMRARVMGVGRMRTSAASARGGGERRGRARDNSAARHLDWLATAAARLWRRFDRRVRPRLRLWGAIGRLRQVVSGYISCLPEALTYAAERAAAAPGFHIASLPLVPPRVVPDASSRPSSQQPSSPPPSLPRSQLPAPIATGPQHRRIDSWRSDPSSSTGSPRRCSSLSSSSAPQVSRPLASSHLAPIPLVPSPRLSSNLRSPSIDSPSIGFPPQNLPSPSHSPPEPSPPPPVPIPRPAKRSASQQCPSPPPLTLRHRCSSQHSSSQHHLNQCPLKPLLSTLHKAGSSCARLPKACHQFPRQKDLPQLAAERRSPFKQSLTANNNLLSTSCQPTQPALNSHFQEGNTPKERISTPESSGDSGAKAPLPGIQAPIPEGSVQIPQLRLPSPPSPSNPSSSPPSPSPMSLSPLSRDPSASIATTCALKAASLQGIAKKANSNRGIKGSRSSKSDRLFTPPLEEMERARKGRPPRYLRKRSLVAGERVGKRVGDRKSERRSCRCSGRNSPFPRPRVCGGGRKHQRPTVPGHRMFLIHRHLLAMQERRERGRQRALSLAPRRAFSALPGPHETLDMGLAEGGKPISALMRLVAWNEAAQRLLAAGGRTRSPKRRRSKRKHTKRSTRKKTSTREVATSALPIGGNSSESRRSQKIKEMQSQSDTQFNACVERDILSKALSDSFNGKEDENNRVGGNISHLPLHLFKFKDVLNAQDTDVLLNEEETKLNETSQIRSKIGDACSLGGISNSHGKLLNVLGAVLVVGPSNTDKIDEKSGNVSTAGCSVIKPPKADDRRVTDEPISIEVGVDIFPSLTSSDVETQNVEKTEVISVLEEPSRTEINTTDVMSRPRFKSVLNTKSSYCTESQQNVRDNIVNKTSDFICDSAQEIKKIRNIINKVQSQTDRREQHILPAPPNSLKSSFSKYNSLDQVSEVRSCRPRISRHRGTEFSIGGTNIKCNENHQSSTTSKQFVGFAAIEVHDRFTGHVSPSNHWRNQSFDRSQAPACPYGTHRVNSECSRLFLAHDSDVVFSEIRDSHESNSFLNIANRENRNLTYSMVLNGTPLSPLSKSIDNRISDSSNWDSEYIVRHSGDNKINPQEKHYISTKSPILFDDLESVTHDEIIDKVSNELLTSCENVLHHRKRLIASGSHSNTNFKLDVPKPTSSRSDYANLNIPNDLISGYMGYANLKNNHNRLEPPEDSQLIYNRKNDFPKFAQDHVHQEQTMIKPNKDQAMEQRPYKILDSDDDSYHDRLHERNDCQIYGYNATNIYKRPSKGFSHVNSFRKQKKRIYRSVSLERNMRGGRDNYNRLVGSYQFVPLSPVKDNSPDGNQSHDSFSEKNASNSIKCLQSTYYYNNLYKRYKSNTGENTLVPNPSTAVSSFNMPFYNRRLSSSSSTYSQGDEFACARFWKCFSRRFCHEELKARETDPSKQIIRNMHSRANSETTSCLRKSISMNISQDVFPQRSITCLMVSPDTPPRLPSTPNGLPLKREFINSPDHSAGRSTNSSVYPNSTLPSSVVRTPTASIASSKKCIKNGDDINLTNIPATKSSILEIGASLDLDNDLDDSNPLNPGYVSGESCFIPSIPLGENGENVRTDSAAQNASFITAEWAADSYIMSETNVSSSAYYEQYFSVSNDPRESTAASVKSPKDGINYKNINEDEESQSKPIWEQTHICKESINPSAENPNQRFQCWNKSLSNAFKNVIENELTISGSSDICHSSIAQSTQVRDETYSIGVPSVNVLHSLFVHGNIDGGMTVRKQRDWSPDSNHSSQPVASSALDDLPEDPPSTHSDAEKQSKRHIEMPADYVEQRSQSSTITPSFPSPFLSPDLRRTSDYKTLVTCLDRHASMLHDIGVSRGIENLPQRPESASLGDRDVSRQEYMQALRAHLQLVRNVCPRAPEEAAMGRPSMAALLLI